jgi:hypothetical protein
MNNYFLNTRKYDKKAKRLAIFGREVIKGEVEIFILRCSKEDRFSKKVAKRIYEYYLEPGLEKMEVIFPEFHPIIQNVIIEKGNTARWTFDRFCDLFYNKYSVDIEHPTIDKNGELYVPFTTYYEYLECGGETITINKSLKFRKNLKNE